MSEMELMCDRVAIIDNGNLVSINTVENMLQAVSGDSIVYSYNVSNYEKQKKLSRASTQIFL